MAELACEALAKSYGTRPVLSDVDLHVPEGTVTAILGASGSGKTTLLRLIIGFISPDRGTIRIGATVVADAPRLHVAPAARAVGYVAQEGALFPHLTAAENVAFGLPRSERRSAARVVEALELVGLGRDYANRRPHELSGGEQRRVALARALAPRPRMVLLDEPFSGLDAALRTETREAVLDALAAEGTTAVLVTHDQAEALSMGREVAVLRAGRLVQTATPAALYESPVDLDIARFVGSAVVVAGHGRSGTVECALGRLTVRGAAVEGPVLVMIRPEQIHLMRSNPQADNPPSQHQALAQVTGRTYYGPDTIVRLALRDDSETALIARTFNSDIPAIGELVGLVVANPVAVYPLLPQSAARTNHNAATP